jgi:hypothetical protein
VDVFAANILSPSSTNLINSISISPLLVILHGSFFYPFTSLLNGRGRAVHLQWKLKRFRQKVTFSLNPNMRSNNVASRSTFSPQKLLLVSSAPRHFNKVSTPVHFSAIRKDKYSIKIGIEFPVNSVIIIIELMVTARSFFSHFRSLHAFWLLRYSNSYNYSSIFSLNSTSSSKSTKCT